MTTLADLKKQVQAKVDETVLKIERMYNVVFRSKIIIRYDINSARLGGLAIYATNTIRLNEHFLEKYADEYINQTVVHEVAHLGIYHVYHLAGRRVGAHGPEWKNMMIRLGAEARRCHYYKADEGVGRKRARYTYICSVCQGELSVGPKHHAAMQRGQIFQHKGCRSGHLTYKPTVQQPLPMAASNKATNAKAPDPSSKLGKCYAVYKKYYGQGFTRQQWISAFVGQGCTPAGASTYLSTCVKLYDQGV